VSLLIRTGGKISDLCYFWVMYDRFLQFIKKHALIDPGDRILVGVSGGVDSMTLLHLLKKSGYPLVVAHCNFQLRGEEANRDEDLVRNYCRKEAITFEVQRFQTKAYSQQKGISTQMAARELRYEWFKMLRITHNCQKVAIAHHLDDSIETFFLNLARGTSLKGLRGIAPCNREVIRPLLEFTKEELIEFATATGIEWREDASNAESYYKRNLIRHQLIPIMHQLNPDFTGVMAQNLQKLSARYYTSERLYDGWRSEFIKTGTNGFHLSKKAVLSVCQSAYDLYELLRDFSFNYATCQQLFDCLQENTEVGKVFLSASHRLVIDREDLLIVNDSNAEVLPQVVMENTGSFKVNGVGYTIRLCSAGQVAVDKASENAMLDFERLRFPLHLRPWKMGDSFAPLGMKGKRKLVSDFLIDAKVPLSEKGKVMVLESKGEIAWLVGFRISEHFKLSTQTTSIWYARKESASH